MDDLATYNKARWEALSGAGVIFSRPWLDLNEASARQHVDPENILKEIAGKDVLCLAGGGGQQSVAFAMLDANVTILDLSETQLQKDQQAAVHYGFQVRALQGDMRDLSAFADNSFDIVWHAHSLNFVPDAHTVFAEVARVLRPGGKYRLSCHNPYLHGVCEDNWNGEGYVLKLPYVDGEVQYDTPEWDVETGDGTLERIVGPKEFRHTLNTLINGLMDQGFIILRVSEDTHQGGDAEPGTWEHFATVTAPYIAFWLNYQPNY
jgi:2-polyprenyl-3-methyl-5-hydroxy-6-metoxy-1,4-benzoquinol methylase